MPLMGILDPTYILVIIGVIISLPNDQGEHWSRVGQDFR